MRSLLILLVACMIAKDIAFVPFPYALRVIAQGACLLAVLASLVFGATSIQARHFTVIWLYFLALLASMLGTLFPAFVALEIGSLAAVIFFFIVYFNQANANLPGLLRAYTTTIFVVYTVASIASLAALKLFPDVAYEHLYAGDMVGLEHRFRGLFPKAGGMATCAGLAAGLALLLVKRSWLRITLFVPNAVCLVLTQSRTFWIALVVGLTITMWRKRTNVLPFVGVSIVIGMFAVVGLAVNGSQFDLGGLEKLARLDTVSNLTGRTSLWTESFEGFTRRPLLGYGFTMGSTALAPPGAGNGSSAEASADPTQWSKMTMHDGYMQCLLDTGLFGASCYVAVIVISLRRLFTRDPQVRYPTAWFGLIYLTVANLTESVIYAAASFPGICFWGLAVFAMSLPESASVDHSPERPSRVGAVRLFENLMR